VFKLTIFRVFALASGAGVLLVLPHYPVGWVPLAVGLAAYAGVLAYRPHAWLAVLPAALPLLNLYPWTGWLYIEEFDLAVLVTLAVGYAHASSASPGIRVRPIAVVPLALLTCSYLVSAALPLAAYDSWDWADAATYNTPLNSLRVLKGFAWALLLLPLLTRAADGLGTRFSATLFKGMLGGLAAASAVVVWERWAFPGLMNFSTDYRAIGPFFEAHVGGAAIDGYLALTLPFAAVMLLTARGLPQIALGAMLMLLGSYATFATFSRGLYAGSFAAVVLIGLLMLRQRASVDLGFRAVALLIAFGICGLLLYQVFASGGYRTLAAALGACGAAVYAGTLRERLRVVRFAAIVSVLCTITILMTLTLPKGAYLAYALALLVLGAAIALRMNSPAMGGELALAACAWLGIGTIAIGWHWGGAQALQDAAVAVAVIATAAVYNRSTNAPLWLPGWGTATGSIAAGLFLAISIPVIGNYYMQTRFDTVGKDLDLREEHWSGTVAMRAEGWIETLLGAGLGRYPERYFWNNPGKETPGVLAYMREGERRFVRLGSPRTPLGYGEPLRLSQHIAIGTSDRLTLEIDLRSQAPKSRLNINLCEKWLLYVLRCMPKPVWLHPQPGGWTHHSVELIPPAPQPTGRRLRPQVLTITVGGADSVVDVTRVSVTDRSGRQLVDNGDFSHGGDRWYFSSDHVHLPWHAKNLWLGIWFDQGWMGLLAAIGFGVAALGCAYARAARGDRLAVTLAASLTAFMVVGLFDTLLDATRLATLFYLLALCATLEVRIRRRRHAHRRRMRTPKMESHGTGAGASVS
jgi:hypothetical protein